MVKQRMSTADVAGETACLRQNLLGMRVANIYDVNAKVLLSFLAVNRVISLHLPGNCSIVDDVPS